MANRATGTFTFAANFETEFQGPLDARLTTPELTQLTDGSLPFAYNGMCVAVTNDEDRGGDPGGSADNNGLYILIDDSATPGSDINKWTKLGDAPGGGGNPVTAIAYTAATGELKVTLTHDGTANEDTANPLEYTTDVIPTYNSALDSTIAMTQTIGGLSAGTTVADLDGDTISSVLDSLLFPTAPPTFSQPFVTLTGTSGLKVVGSENTFTLVTTANKGTLSNPSGPLAGDVTAASISGPQGITLGVSSPNNIDDLSISNYTAVLGTNAWTLTATFAIGPMPLDSTNSQYPSAQFPGTPDKTSGVSFEGVYPYFLGTSAGEDQFTERALITMGANNVECLQNYPEDSGATGNPVLNHRILVPVARSAGAITIQVFNPNGSGAAAWPDNTAFWTEGAQVQRTIEFNQVDYRVFTKDGSSGGANNYRLVF
jgi:hypothetical protein